MTDELKTLVGAFLNRYGKHDIDEALLVCEEDLPKLVSAVREQVIRECANPVSLEVNDHELREIARQFFPKLVHGYGHEKDQRNMHDCVLAMKEILRRSAERILAQLEVNCPCIPGLPPTPDCKKHGMKLEGK